MTQYVVNVPNPPPGTDWQWAVPGIYMYDITSVSATLTTPLIPTGVAFDSSGLGHDGVYEQIFGPIKFAPGLVAGNLSWLSGDIFPTTTVYTVDTPYVLAGWDAPFTIGWWMSFPDLPNGSGFAIFEETVAPPDDSLTIAGTVGTTGPTQSIILNAPPLGPWVANNLFAHGTDIYFVAITWAGAQPSLYVNGELVPWAITPGGTPSATSSGGSSIGSPGAGTANVVDEFVTFPYALPAGAIADIFEAGLQGFPYWNAAVIPLGPNAFYHFQDAISVGRQVDLEITDGTHVVTDIPTGFGTSNDAVAYSYSWQSALGANTISENGGVTSVAIPELLLPGGYTVGTRTPDIGPDDQWSDITIWWNDSHQQLVSGAYDYGFPPGRFYVYQQQGT